MYMPVTRNLQIACLCTPSGARTEAGAKAVGRARGSMAKNATLTNSERKDRSIRLWGGTRAPRAASARCARPAAAAERGGRAGRLTGRATLGRARAAGAGAGPRLRAERDRAGDGGAKEPDAPGHRPFHARRQAACHWCRARSRARCVPAMLARLSPWHCSSRVARGGARGRAAAACRRGRRPPPEFLRPFSPMPWQSETSATTFLSRSRASASRAARW